MAKALFLSLPLHGHTNPSLPLVRELARRGEEIIYYSSDAFATKIQQAGAHYRPYRNAFLKDMRDVPDRMEELGWLLMRTTGEVLGQELDAFGAERPDYVITDSVAPWGRCVAILLGMPWVASVPTFAFSRRVVAYAFAHGVRPPKNARLILSKMRHTINALRLSRRLRRLHGVSPGLANLLFSYSDLNIVYTSRYFQPRAETFDDRFQFVGPSMTPRTETAGFPWEQVRHPVVVYVSLGTLFNMDATFYRNCFEAFRTEDYQVILSVGENVTAGALGPAPPNFIVRTYVPQLEVLRRTTVFVTHGGMNSVSESLGNGVPVVAIPQMSEQAIVGRRVEELGAGLYLAKGEVTAEKLRELVQRILAEDRFRRQAALVRESFEAAGGVVQAADKIMEFTKPLGK